MSERDIEQELSELSTDWPGHSVAESVSQQLAQHAPEQDRQPHPALSSGREFPRANAHRRSSGLYRWIVAIASTAAIVGIVLWPGAPQNLHAALQESLGQAKSWHVIVRVFDGQESSVAGEIWFHRDHGMRMEEGGRVTVDDGKISHSWPPEGKKVTVLRRPSMEGLAMVTEMFDLSRVPDDWSQKRAKDLDETMSGADCRAFLYEYNGPGTPDSFRHLVWIDEQDRPRKMLLQREAGNEWESERTMLIHYEHEISQDTFALNYPAEATVFDAEAALETRFPLKEAVATEQRDGLLFALHDVVAIDDQSYYVVSSVRGTPEYLAKYPPEKRRLNFNYTATDVASQSRAHGSNGNGQQAVMFGMEWQGVDYLWRIFIPRLQNRPTNGAEEGMVRIPLFASHASENRRDERGVQMASQVEIDVAVDREHYMSLERVIERARDDMDTVSAVFGETSSMPIAMSISDSMQYTSFDKISTEEYADELRKTRWQLETGDFSGTNPPPGFEAKFAERWIPPEDPTKDFRDAQIDLPTTVTGQVLDIDGAPIAGASVQVRVRRFHPKQKVVEKSGPGPWNATTDQNGNYTLEVTGAINQKHDEVRVRASQTGFVTADEYDYLKEILDGSLPAVRLLPSEPVKGRVVDTAGAPIANAILRFQSNNADFSRTWDSGPFTAEPDGTFSLEVPKNCSVAGAVYCQGHAPRLIPLLEVGDQGDIVVQPGTPLKGRVLNQQGQGVANTVVGIRSKEYIELHAYLVMIATAVKTDENGDFELPPLDGSFTLTVTNSAPDYSRQRMVNGKKPPKIEPKTIDTRKLDSQEPIILQER